MRVVTIDFATELRSDIGLYLSQRNGFILNSVEVSDCHSCAVAIIRDIQSLVDASNVIGLGFGTSKKLEAVLEINSYQQGSNHKGESWQLVRNIIAPFDTYFVVKNDHRVHVYGNMDDLEIILREYDRLNFHKHKSDSSSILSLDL